jgi:hypothetical protein
MTHWLEEYNNARPHGALDGLTPRAFAAQCSRQVLEDAACTSLTWKLVALLWA